MTVPPSTRTQNIVQPEQTFDGSVAIVAGNNFAQKSVSELPPVPHEQARGMSASPQPSSAIKVGQSTSDAIGRASKVADEAVSSALKKEVEAKRFEAAVRQLKTLDPGLSDKQAAGKIGALVFGKAFSAALRADAGGKDDPKAAANAAVAKALGDAQQLAKEANRPTPFDPPEASRA